MDFNLSDSQRILRQEVKAFLEREWSLDELRRIESNGEGYSTGHWKRMADLGWLELINDQPPPHDHGLTELCVLAVEFGYHLFPSPLIDSTGVFSCLMASDDPQARVVTQAILSGRRTVAVAWLETAIADQYDCVRSIATKLEGDWSVRGSKDLVFNAAGAEWILWPAVSESGEALLLLIRISHTGASITKCSASLGDPYYRVALDGAPLSPDTMVLTGGEIFTRARRRAGIILCAQMAGASRRVLEMTVDYAGFRKQFGKPIGSFQAVQWLCVDIATRVERLELLMWQAAALEDEQSDSSLAVHACLAFGTREIGNLMRSAHEVFAGLGFMAAHDLQMFSRRALGWQMCIGTSRFWSDQLIDRRANTE